TFAVAAIGILGRQQNAWRSPRTRGLQVAVLGIISAITTSCSGRPSPKLDESYLERRPYGTVRPLLGVALRPRRLPAGGAGDQPALLPAGRGCLSYLRFPMHHKACDVRRNNCPSDTAIVLKQ